jgi:hypothetical protein
MGKPAEVVDCILRRLADDPHVQAGADHGGEVSERCPLLGGPVISRSQWSYLRGADQRRCSHALRRSTSQLLFAAPH